MEVLNLETFKSKIFDFEKNKEWVFSGQKPVIIDFYADWCGPCRALAPILETVADDYKGLVDIYKIDTEASPDLAAMFGIRSIPSILFVPLTGEPAMSAGLIREDGFEKAIRELFNISKP